jgi:DNA-binding NarL/FixJ family response regulator
VALPTRTGRHLGRDPGVRTPASGARTPDAAGVADLTAREREVPDMIIEGLSNQEISERLFVSEGTTKTHLPRTLAKLALRDRVQVVIYAYEHGIVRRA